MVAASSEIPCTCKDSLTLARRSDASGPAVSGGVLGPMGLISISGIVGDTLDSRSPSPTGEGTKPDWSKLELLELLSGLSPFVTSARSLPPN